MVRLLIVSAALLVSVPAAAQQCPSSAVRVEIAAGSTPGCVTATPAADEPEINIANNCDEDQFNIAAGIDCPNCGPPVTLRAGNFGPFIVDTRPLSQFEPTTPTEDHVLDWALGNQTGTLTARVVPDITICPVPDMGMGDMTMIDEAEPDPIPEGNGGCGTVAGRSGVAVLGFALLLAAYRRRRDQREHQ